MKEHVGNITYYAKKGHSMKGRCTSVLGRVVQEKHDIHKELTMQLTMEKVSQAKAFTVSAKALRQELRWIKRPAEKLMHVSRWSKGEMVGRMP